MQSPTLKYFIVSTVLVHLFRVNVLNVKPSFSFLLMIDLFLLCFNIQEESLVKRFYNI